MQMQGPLLLRLVRLSCHLAGAAALCVCAESACRAQPGPAPFEPPPRFERLPVPKVTVFDIQQDSQGFIWLATESGLYRWDGYRATLYRPGVRDGVAAGSLNTN